MRVLYLTEEAITFSGTLVRGGAIHVRNVVSGLRERGHDAHLVDWSDDPEEAFQHSISPRVRPVEGATHTLCRAVQVGRKCDVEVIVSKTRKTYLPGLVAARRLGVPHVVHVGSSIDPPTNGLLNRFDAASFAFRLRLPHDAYLVVCDAIAEELRTLGVRGTIHNVQNAVDTDEFRPDAPVEASSWLEDALAEHADDFRLGYVGGLHEYKGVFDLASALQQTEGVHLFVAGDGPARERFEREVGECATFFGAVPYEAIPAVYQGIDALALPSHTEGLPRVVLEAMAAETPVIATRVGGVPEVIDDGETGVLCDAHDPAALVEAIDRLATDEGRREVLGRNGRVAVETEFAWEQLYDRYEHDLERVVERADE